MLLGWLSLSWRRRLITLDYSQYLDGIKEDFGTFLDVVLVDEAPIGVNGLKPTILEWRWGIQWSSRA